MGWKPDYATRDQFAHFVKVSGDEDDVWLNLAITAASRAIDKQTHRQFGLSDTAVDRFYTPRYVRDETGCQRWEIEIDDLMTTTGLVIGYDGDQDQTYGDALTAYDLEPINAAADGVPWEKIVIRRSSSVFPTARRNCVRVTARFGWTEVPDTIYEATLLQASRVLSRRDSPYGVAGSPENGSEFRVLAKVDADVAVAVRPYVRWWGAR